MKSFFFFKWQTTDRDKKRKWKNTQPNEYSPIRETPASYSPSRILLTSMRSDQQHFFPPPLFDQIFANSYTTKGFMILLSTFYWKANALAYISQVTTKEDNPACNFWVCQSAGDPFILPITNCTMIFTTCNRLAG